MTAIHFRSARHYVNAGISIPVCVAGAEFLNLDAARWPTTGDGHLVTCGNCARILRANKRAYLAQDAEHSAATFAAGPL